MISETISHYRVISKLGAGGMGEVYLAQDTRLDRKVAVKILPEQFTKDETRLRRFVQEAKTASALNHPNIITIYDIGVDNDGCFIAMEYVQGRTLQELISEGLSPGLLAMVGRQVAAALTVAHAAGIIHRDIKPDNIILRDDGYLKVLDFGLARLCAIEGSTESSADTAIHTNPGMIVGTLAYMSPEQSQGGTLTSATDIFSLGTVFYEMVTGQKPFISPSQIGTLHAIIYEQPLPPSQINTNLSPTAELLILRMLDKNPLRRPTASEIASALSDSMETISLSSNIMAMPSASALISRATVGREQEREKMRRAFQMASVGRGMMLCITGEAGLGKSTLVDDFLAEILQENPSCHVARGRSSERLAGADAYLPFLEALESVLRGAASQFVARLMKTIAPSWYIQLTVSHDSSIERAMAESQAVSQERMKRELVAFLQEISRDNPLVLFFDDLHWAGASTIDIIAYIATKLERMRLLIVTTYRPSEMFLNKHPFLSLNLDMQARGISQELRLEFLTREDVERYLALEFTNHRFPAELASLIYTKTEGSPLFMVDVTRYLRDKRIIGEDEGHWALVQSVPEIEHDLPETVRSMIRRKIAQLSDGDRRLLVAASAQGYKFDSAVIAQTLSMDAGEVEECLEALDQTYGFVKYLKEEEFSDHTLTLKYRFVHVLYQNVLYASLTPSRRASLSGAIAQAIEGYHGKQSSAAASELALLYQAARNWSRASHYYLIAARNAARVFANKEAIALGRRGLEMIKKLPDAADSARLELKFQLTMGQSLMTVYGFAASDTLQAYLRAHELSEQLSDDSQLFRVQFGLSIVYVVRAEHDKARHFAEQCLQVAERVRDSALLVQGHWILALSLQYLGEFVAAREHLEQSISLYDLKLHAAHAFLYGAILNRAHLGRVLLYLGFPDNGRVMLQEGLSVAEKMRHPVGLCNALTIAFSIEAFHQNLEKAREMAETMLLYSDEHGLLHYAGVGKVMRGWALAMQGEAEEGIAQIREGLSVLRAAETEQQRANYLGLLAEALCKAGRTEKGLEALDEALKSINDTGERFFEAELYRIKGDLLIRRRPSEEGRQSSNEIEMCFRKAIEIARRQSARSFELRAVMGLARFWSKEGKQAEAAEMLSQIYGWFTEGFDTADLKEARALIDELS